MLLAGDELGNSQAGNNNAYCQDNDIGWLTQLARQRGRGGKLDRINGSGLARFSSNISSRFVKQHPVLRRRALSARTDSFRLGGIEGRHPGSSPDGNRESRRRTGPTTGRRTIGLMLAGDAGDDRDAIGA